VHKRRLHSLSQTQLPVEILKQSCATIRVESKVAHGDISIVNMRQKPDPCEILPIILIEQEKQFHILIIVPGCYINGHILEHIEANITVADHSNCIRLS